MTEYIIEVDAGKYVATFTSLDWSYQLTADRQNAYHFQSATEAHIMAVMYDVPASYGVLPEEQTQFMLPLTGECNQYARCLRR